MLAQLLEILLTHRWRTQLYSTKVCINYDLKSGFKGQLWELWELLPSWQELALPKSQVIHKSANGWGEQNLTVGYNMPTYHSYQGTVSLALT